MSVAAVAFSGFAVPALELIVVKLFSLVNNSLRSTSKIDANLGKITRTLQRIKSTLLDLEKCRMYDQSILVWCRHLKEVIYDVDDFLSEIATGKGAKWVQQADLNKNPATAINIEKFRKRLDDLLDEIDTIHSKALMKMSTVFTKERVVTTSLVEEASILGRTNDKLKVKDMLINSEALEKNFDIVSIVGTMGIGKTTLAKLVYNDEEIIRIFNKRIWVSMTESFDSSVATKLILESVCGESIDGTDLNLLQERLKLKLFQVRFLIVIDGCWHSKQSEWDDFYLPLRCGGKGSKILVTTQSHIVSRTMYANDFYNLEKLSDDDCLLLFSREAFRFSAQNETLLQLAKSVVKKWHGIPLVAKSLGKILSNCSDEIKWGEVLSNELGDLTEYHNDMFDAIRLTCYHIPPYLRECLAYCSLFPSGHMFKKDILIQMWMAQDYIESTSKRSMEEIGADYIDEFVKMSLFQIDPNDASRFLLRCITHMLAKYMAFDDCLRLVKQEDMKYHSSISVNARHATIVESNFDRSSVGKFKKLRTLLIPCKVVLPEDFICGKSFENSKLLRVLDLSHGEIKELPRFLSRLKHLRYLDLFGARILVLPDSILTLSSLETLRLKGCTGLNALPVDFHKLINLSYLGLDLNAHFTCMPRHMDKMPHLHTLSAFFVGISSLQMKMLKNMDQLSGTLRILKLENIRTGEMTSEVLSGKKHIKRLILRWGTQSGGETAEVVLNDMKPHSNLTELQIFGYNGLTFPDWIGEASLSNIHTLVLSECGSCSSLPMLGNLPCLKDLSINKLSEVVHIDGNVTNGFPLLDILSVSDMANLKEWNGSLEGQCPKLRLLKISSCPKLDSLPELHYLGSLKDLHLIQCPGLESLPGFPESLMNIKIRDCPLLQEKCEPGGSESENLDIRFGNPDDWISKSI